MIRLLLTLALFVAMIQTEHFTQVRKMSKLAYMRAKPWLEKGYNGVPPEILAKLTESDRLLITMDLNPGLRVFKEATGVTVEYNTFTIAGHSPSATASYWAKTWGDLGAVGILPRIERRPWFCAPPKGLGVKSKR